MSQPDRQPDESALREALTWPSLPFEEWADLCGGIRAYGDDAPGMLAAAIIRERELRRALSDTPQAQSAPAPTQDKREAFEAWFAADCKRLGVDPKEPSMSSKSWASAAWRAALHSTPDSTRDPEPPAEDARRLRAEARMNARFQSAGAVASSPAPREAHRPGCPALGGYGHGVEECICGAQGEAPAGDRGVQQGSDTRLREAARELLNCLRGPHYADRVGELMQDLDAALADQSPKEPL